MKRIVQMNVVPGQPTDGSGMVCIHLFVQDKDGKFVEPHAIHPVLEHGVPVKQKVQCLATRGRLACDPNRTPHAVRHGNVSIITPRSDDPRAVTCPKCKATTEYIAMMARLEGT